MRPDIVLDFTDDPAVKSDDPTITANPLVALSTGTATLATYGRAVWPSVRDASLAWRRGGPGVPLVRAEGYPDAMWWAAVDGAFEARGGVVDLLYRVAVVDAVLSDRPGPVLAIGTEDDPWLAATTAVCAARSRDLRIRSTPPTHAADVPASRRRQASLLLRRAAGVARGRSRHADLMVVLTHGRMARRTPAGQIADVYTRNLLDPLVSRGPVSIVSLEAPAGMELADLAAIATGAYRPWLRWCSLPELRESAPRREMWAAVLRDAKALSLMFSGIDLGPALDVRAVALVARGLAVAELYSRAFGRALAEIAPRAVLATEGHSNVGRVLGAIAPELPLVAPQAGVIGPDGVTNAAYDHRGLDVVSADGRTGCPVPSDSLVWGPFYAHVVAGLGHDPARVTVTGLPRALPQRTGDGAEVLYIAGANDDVCAFAAGFADEIVSIRAIADSTSSPVRVRLHPTHDRARYRAALGPEVRLSEGGRIPLADDLASARVVTGKSSTALVESAAGGWPVVVVNLGPTPDLTGFGDAGLDLIEDARELTQALEGAQPAVSAAASLAWPRDQDAIARTVDRIEDVVGAH